MADFFNFYPADGSKTVPEIPAEKVAGTPDAFGCIETPEGLYVPTMKMDWVPDLGPSETPADFGDQFAIGQSVMSAYHGVTGKVVAHGAEFGGRPSIVVEHQVMMLDDPTKTMMERRTFLSHDFKGI